MIAMIGLVLKASHSSNENLRNVWLVVKHFEVEGKVFNRNKMEVVHQNP